MAYVCVCMFVVRVHIWVGTHVWLGICTCKGLKLSSGSSSIILHHIYWERISLWIQGLPVLASLTSSLALGNPVCPHTCLFFSLVLGNLNSCPYACMTSALSTELPPQPLTDLCVPRDACSAIALLGDTVVAHESQLSFWDHSCPLEVYPKNTGRAILLNLWACVVCRCSHLCACEVNAGCLLQLYFPLYF